MWSRGWKMYTIGTERPSVARVRVLVEADLFRKYFSLIIAANELNWKEFDLKLDKSNKQAYNQILEFPCSFHFLTYRQKNYFPTPC